MLGLAREIQESRIGTIGGSIDCERRRRRRAEAVCLDEDRERSVIVVSQKYIKAGKAGPTILRIQSNQLVRER